MGRSGARFLRVAALLLALAGGAAPARVLAQAAPEAPTASPDDAGVPNADPDTSSPPAPAVTVTAPGPNQAGPSASASGVDPVSPAEASAESAEELDVDELPPTDVEAHSKEAASPRYLLERVRIVGNHRTKAKLIKRFVSVPTGSAFSVDDPAIQALRYRLLGTGWYDRVDLRLERGERPGWVVLVIEVEERQTIVFQQLAAGVGWSVAGVNVNKKNGASSDPGRQAEPYLGLALAETNLLGTGRTLGGELLVAPRQQGFALNYFDPLLKRSRWSFRALTSLVKGQEYFGGDRDVMVSVQCDPSELHGRKLQDCEITPPAAVVNYWRAGLGLGTARDVGSFTRLSLDWHGDYVNVPPGGMPAAASQLRGTGPSARQPIDFSIEPYGSFVSMVSAGLTYDKRDSAVLPSRGTLASFLGDLASPLIGSSYEFVRLQASVNHWTPFRWGHTIRVGAYAGAVYGYSPFFYKFFVSDLTDLMPSRILGLNLDHRPAPNLFGVLQCGRAFDPHCGTAIAQMRHEDLAARIDAEYVWPFLRGRKKFLRSGDVFVLLGLYALANPSDLRLALPGYSGLARLPIDLTFDFGVRLDTQMGVFQIGMAKLLWLPVGVMGP